MTTIVEDRRSAVFVKYVSVSAARYHFLNLFIRQRSSIKIAIFDTNDINSDFSKHFNNHIDTLAVLFVPRSTFLRNVVIDITVVNFELVVNCVNVAFFKLVINRIVFNIFEIFLVASFSIFLKVFFFASFKLNILLILMVRMKLFLSISILIELLEISQQSIILSLSEEMISLICTLIKSASRLLINFMLYLFYLKSFFLDLISYISLFSSIFFQTCVQIMIVCLFLFVFFCFHFTKLSYSSSFLMLKCCFDFRLYRNSSFSSSSR